MGPVVNLRTARKQAKRRLAEQEAARNRLTHGRSKARQALDEAHGERVRKTLDQHRIEPEDGR